MLEGNPILCPFCKSVYCDSVEALCIHKGVEHRKAKLYCFVCNYKSSKMAKWLHHLSKKHSIETPLLTNLASVEHTGEPDVKQEFEEVTASASSSSQVLLHGSFQGKMDITESNCDAFHNGEVSVPFQEMNSNNVRKHKLSDSSIENPLKVKLPFLSQKGKEVGGESSDKMIIQTNGVQSFQEMSSDNAEKQKLSDSSIENPHKVKFPFLSQKEKELEGESSYKTIVQPDDAQPIILCNHCDKVFKSEAGFKRHQNKLKAETETGENEQTGRSVPEPTNFGDAVLDGKCPKCSKIFETDAELKRHIQMHCPTCCYVAPSRAVLERHLRTHTGTKLFHCPYCDFQAAVKSSVTLHIRTHTNKRPFPCDQCSYAARTSSQLISHKLTHSGDKPYRCNLCGKRFTQAGSLGRHLKKEVCIDIGLSSF